MSRIFAYVVLSALLLVLGGCRGREIPVVVTESTVVTAVETAVPVETAAVEEILLERAENGKVCVGFIPTEVGNWRYVVIDDQEAAVAAWE